MNRLQSLGADREFFVTLNRSEAIDPDAVIRTIDYAHPVFTPEGVAAQGRWAEISGSGGRTTAAPTGAGASTRTASGRRCAGRRGARRRAAHCRSRTSSASETAAREPIPSGSWRRRHDAPPRSTRAGWRTAGSVRSRTRSATGVFMPLFDLDELPELLDSIPLWSARRPGAGALPRDDYLLGGVPDRWPTRARDLAQARLGRRPAGPVRLLANPRYLGVGFNPVSFLFLHGEDGSGVDSVIAEVTNTPWGERTAYVLDGGAGADAAVTGTFEKRMHVSPFQPMEQTYEISVERTRPRGCASRSATSRATATVFVATHGAAPARAHAAARMVRLLLALSADDPRDPGADLRERAAAETSRSDDSIPIRRWEQMSKLFGYLSYRDLDAAITWLEALGFKTTTRQQPWRRHRPRGCRQQRLRAGGDRVGTQRAGVLDLKRTEFAICE